MYKKREQEKKGIENYKNNQKITNKMIISTYIFIITLNVGGPTASIGRHMVAKEIKNKTCGYSAHKRLTSDGKTHRG